MFRVSSAGRMLTQDLQLQEFVSITKLLFTVEWSEFTKKSFPISQIEF